MLNDCDVRSLVFCVNSLYFDAQLGVGLSFVSPFTVQWFSLAAQDFWWGVVRGVAMSGGG